MKIILLISILSFSLFSQSQSRFDLAKSLEADGQLEKALTIYESLYEADPTKLPVVEALKRNYRALAKHERRLAIISAQIKSDTANPGLLSELADAYFKLLKNSDGIRITNRIIAIDPKSISLYRTATSVLLENKQFDAAEKIYHSGREALQNQSLFLLELTRLYGYRGDYDKAVSEIIKYYRSGQGTWDYARTQILQWSDQTTSTDKIMPALQKEASLRDDERLERVISEMYFKRRQYTMAFESTRKLDLRFKKNGTEILSFAEMAYQQQVYGLAYLAYEAFLREYPLAPQAEMGKARCLERLTFKDSVLVFRDSLQNQSERFYYDRALGTYGQLIQKYPKSEFSAEAFFRIGDLYLREYFDIDAAIRNFEMVEKTFAGSPFVIESQFKLAESHIIKGDLEAPLLLYRRIMLNAFDKNIDDRALLAVGEILFFRSQFDSTLALMRAVAIHSDGLYTNDALTYICMIEENKKSPAIQFLARAAYLEKQKKFSESLAQLEKCIRENAGLPIEDDAWFMKALILSKQSHWLDALSAYRRVIDFPVESSFGDLALIKCGEIYETRLQDSSQASRMYKELLTRFPKSVYQNEARKKLRQFEKLPG